MSNKRRTCTQDLDLIELFSTTNIIEEDVTNLVRVDETFKLRQHGMQVFTESNIPSEIKHLKL